MSSDDPYNGKSPSSSSGETTQGAGSPQPVASFDNLGKFVINDPAILDAITGGKGATPQQKPHPEAAAISSNDPVPSIDFCADIDCVPPADETCVTPV